MKICRKCKIKKSLINFHKSKRHKLGYKNECAECTNKYLRERYTKKYKNCPKLRLKRLEYHYKTKYNITYNDYLHLCKNKLYKCDICGIKKKPAGKEKRGSKNHLILDHNHKNGNIRGILCQECNQGLGLFKDKPLNLIFAAIYLEEQN